jgi:hypothetical protein
VFEIGDRWTIANGRGEKSVVNPLPRKPRPLRTQCRWEYNTRMHLEDIWLENGDWFHVAQDMN